MNFRNYKQFPAICKKSEFVIIRLVVNCQFCFSDAEIVYGKLAKRKRKRNKSSSSELDATTLDSVSLKQERTRRKRALAKAQYEEISKKSQATSSLHNETLTSLQTGSEKSSKDSVPIKYNIYASKELRKIKNSRFHWRKHRVDFEHNLKCHKLSYSRISHKYRASSYILSLNKLYAILYIGLLIVKDKIQLGDMLRFIKEGHLSFNYYSHLFPEDFEDKVLNFRNFKKNKFFANGSFRLIASEILILLKVEYYISRPNLLELSERYCKELNLPQEICNCVKNILSKIEIRMSRRYSAKIPNYEGRVLSIILFVIKLLFGLDGVTEKHLANYSEILNSSQAVKPKMFNIIDWLKFLEYRDLVLKNQHFPTGYTDDNNFNNVKTALNVFGKREYSKKLNKAQDNYKQLLVKLKDENIDCVDFPITLTPFSDYIKFLPKDNYLEILSKDFSDESLVHILKPTKFLEMLNSPEIVNSGANEDWLLEKVTLPQSDDQKKLRKRRSLVTVKLSFDRDLKPKIEEPPELDQSRDIEKLKTDFFDANKAQFARNLRKLSNKDLSNVLDYDLDLIRKDLEARIEEYPKHYNPYERFWVLSRIGIEKMSQKDCRTFIEKFPYNFRLVFNECQRIAQQSEQEFLVEYHFTELFLVHLANYGKPKRQPVLKNRLIAKYLNDNKLFW